MEEHDQHNLGEGIVYHACIPFEWRAVSDREADGAAVARIEANEHHFRTIAVLNEYPVDMAEEHHHLEFKMNLLLEMMGEVLASQLSLPPKTLVNLGASGMTWQAQCEDMPAQGQQVVIDLYLHPQYPKPVTLPASVKAVAELEGGSCLCQLQFDAMPDGLNDQMEKFIFTHHRRQVAHSRRQNV